MASTARTEARASDGQSTRASAPSPGSPSRDVFSTILKVGLVAFVATILADIISGRLPATVTARQKAIGQAVIGLVGGVLLYGESKELGLGLGIMGAVVGANEVYTELGLDARIASLLSGATAPAALGAGGTGASAGVVYPLRSYAR